MAAIGLRLRKGGFSGAAIAFGHTSDMVLAVLSAIIIAEGPHAPAWCGERYGGGCIAQFPLSATDQLTRVIRSCGPGATTPVMAK